MKIDPNLTPSVAEPSRPSRPELQVGGNEELDLRRSGPASRLSVSEDAKFIQEVRAGVPRVPLRLDLVKEMKQALSEGTLMTEENFNLAVEALLGDL
jgi:hypothetical protein